MTKLILIVGLTGAGKTTYSDQLYLKEKAFTYSIDRLMKSLYWKEIPDNPDMSWFIENQKWYTERISRCEIFIKDEINKCSKIDISCILDLGFTSVYHRMTYINLAKSLSMKPEVHFLDTSLDERLRRIEKRNIVKDKTFSMNVTKEMVEYMESIFEPLSDEEKKYLIK